ncbi:hypothetical protein C2S51_003975 [Perilla frutescens var. frutescens]|nr:hypothetical protein C2S51_003975 [Perilla frutescens var. frutescens]
MYLHRKQIPIYKIHLSLVFLVVIVVVSGEIRCVEREREALLRFKQGLKDDYGYLSSWGSEECCDWDGIYCSNISGHGHVTYIDFYGYSIGGNLSSDLLELHHLNYLDFTFNNFGGSIPKFIGSMKSLEDLCLTENHFSGTIPDDLGALPNCWYNTRALKFLNLNNNNFYGEIPPALGSLQSLEAMHLRGNNLSGKLPPTLKNCRNFLLIDIGEMCHLTRIQMLDLSGNGISGEIPECFTSLGDKNGSILSSYISYHMDFNRDYFDYVLVQWKGRDSEYRKSLVLLKLIDLSSNRLVGSIPKAFSSFKGLISLNLSTNSLTGRIDPNIGEMEMLETLDLSNNQLSGHIPIGLTRLNFLSVLDLANNNLSGQIPVGTQLRGFNASIYSGNSGLCGPPIPLCPNTSITNQGENAKNKDGGLLQRLPSLEFYISLLLGFVVGFWGVVGSLMLKKSWRNDYSELVDVVGDWLAKFKRC